MKLSPKNNQKGFTLVEVVVSLAVISVLIVGVYSLIILSLRITSDNKNYVTAIEIANQKMEQIRNMPYDDVGTISGSSATGTIPQYETIEMGGVFTVMTNVSFVSDPYDNIAGSDPIPNDYKIATIKVSWTGSYGTKSISVFSKIIGKTKEIAMGFGLLELHSVDSNGAPVPNANVRIVNPSLSIDDSTQATNVNGILDLPLLQSFQSYQITVTKPDYSTAKSFDLAAGLTPIHLSITEGNKTAESFSIDRLATLIIKTYSDNIPDNWLVNKATSTSNKKKVSISNDNAGNIYFVWQNEIAATSSGVYIQKFSSGKVRQWADDVRVETTNYESAPSIAASKNGTSYVVWQDNSINLKSVALNNEKSKNVEFAVNKAEVEVTSASADARQKTSAITKLFHKAGYSINFNLAKIKNFVFDCLIKKTQTALTYIKNRFHRNDAVASVSAVVVQKKASSNVNNAKTMSAAFDNTPASGNVIIAVAVHRNDLSSFNTPTNTAGSFTTSVYSDESASLDIGIWHKVAGASEPKTVTITSPNNIDGGVLMIFEVSGLETANLIDVVSKNYQSDLTKTGNTGLSAVSTGHSFGIAAVAFGEDNFTAPTSISWFSSSTNSYTHELWDDWSVGNDGSLGVASILINSVSTQKAVLGPLSVGSNTIRNSALAIFRIKNDTSVNSINTQTDSIIFPAVNQHIGGSFVLSASSTNMVNSVKITEKGSVNAQTGLENIRLYYDIDTNAPYDCYSETYAGTDLQFDASVAFSSPDGSATFTKAGGITIDGTHSLCVYPVIDINTTVYKNDTAEIEITNPETDVIISSGLMAPASAVYLAGTTDLLKPAELQQAHFRFRNDDGDESNASWKNVEDENLIIMRNSPIRLRFAVTNAGSFDSDASSYRIEYGEKITTCAAIAAWSQVPTDNSLDWKISASTNITDGDATTDSTGMSNENTNFKPGQIKDSGSQTNSLVLTASEFTEIEYSLESTNSAIEKSYCFRLTNAGSIAQFNYRAYPEINVVGDDNIYIKSFDSDGSENWAAKRVHLDDTSASQQNPQIAISENFGDATTTIVWEDSRNGNIDVYAQSFDKNGARLWASDLRITSSSTDETMPVVNIDTQDNIYVSWEELGDIYMMKYDLNGTSAWSNPVNITDSGDLDFLPKIGHVSTTGIVLTWSTLEGSLYNSYLALYDFNGGLIWQEKVNVGSDEKNQFYSNLASDDSSIYVSWTDNRNGNDNIYAQKFNFSGTALWGNDQKISDDTDASNQNSPALVISSDDKVFSAWHDERDSGQDIYAIEIGDPGALTPVGNFPLAITGTKLIYTNPIQYKYNQTLTTDSDGDLSLQLEWDTAYQIIASSSLTAQIVSECRPLNCPIDISAGEIKNIEIYVK